MTKANVWESRLREMELEVQGAIDHISTAHALAGQLKLEPALCALLGALHEAKAHAEFLAAAPVADFS